MGLTLEMLREAKRKMEALGPPPPELHFSKYVPALGDPVARPVTDDMRAMVDDLKARGATEQVPVCFQFGGKLFVHPDYKEKFQAQET